jgi:hypothetical protein
MTTYISATVQPPPHLSSNGDDAGWDGPQSVTDQQPCTNSRAQLLCNNRVNVLPDVHNDRAQPEVDCLMECVQDRVVSHRLLSSRYVAGNLGSKRVVGW